MTDPIRVKVFCYSGYTGDETPRRFEIWKHDIEVKEVIDKWLAPEHRYFKVRGDDGNIYILRYDVGTDSWDLTLFSREKQK